MPSISLFTYGTLMIPEIISGLIGRSISGRPATLHGYQRSLIIDATYPGIAPQCNQVVPGILYLSLKHQEIEILNDYEGDLYILSAVQVRLIHGSVSEAKTYILKNEYHHLLTNQDWDLTTFKRQSQATFLRTYQGFKPE